MALQTRIFTWGSYAYKSESNAYVLELTLTEDSTSAADNTSAVTYTLVLKSGSSNRFTGQIDSVLKLNGATVDSGEKQITAAYNSAWTLLSGTAVVTHNTDGALDMPIEVSINTYNSYAPPDKTLNWSWALTAIPRESSFGTIVGNTIGSDITVNINRHDDAYTHAVYYYLGDNRWSAGDIGGASVVICPPMELCDRIATNTKEYELELLLRTFNGSTQVGGDVHNTITVQMPENEDTKPTLEMVLTPGVAQGVTQIEGLYLQGLSKVQAAMRGSGKYGASITGYGLQVDGRSCDDPKQSDFLTEPGQRKVVGTVTDSRGFTTKCEETITVLSYTKPRLKNVAVYRCKSDGTPADDGEYLKICATRDYEKLMVNGVQKNFCAIKWRYRAEKGDFSDRHETILEASAETDTVETESLLDGNLAKEIAYAVEVIAVDTVGQTATATVAVPTERVYTHKPAGGNGIGLGGYCDEDDLLDVHWNARVRKDLRVDGGIHIKNQRMVNFVVEEGTSGIWTYRKWADGKAECWGESDQITTVAENNWGSLYTKDDAISSYQYPFAFVSTPMVHITPNKFSGNLWLFTGSNGTNIQTPTVSIVRPTVMEVTLSAYYYVIGKWKE